MEEAGIDLSNIVNKESVLIPIVLGLGAIGMTVDYAKEVFFEQEKDKDRSKLAEYDFPDSPDPGNNPGQSYNADDQRKCQSIEGAGSVDNFINNNVPKQFQTQVKNAFGSDVKVTTLKRNTTVYRYYGGESDASSYWVTPTRVSDPISELALPPGNTAQYVDSIIVPKGTTILEGTVAPNFDQPGGGYQYYLPNIK